MASCLFYLIFYLAGHFVGDGAFSSRIFEYVHLVKRNRLRKREALIKFFVGLAGKARNNIGSDRRIVKIHPKQFYAFDKIIARVVAVHALKCFITAALERKMKMRTKLF